MPVSSTVAAGGTILATQYNNLRLDAINRAYATIVDAAGNGDYTLLSAAITAGKKYIFIKAGTYSESAHIDIPVGAHVRGESMRDVIIDFGGNGASLRTAAPSTYNTGTVTVTLNSTTVTGSGTTWTSDMEGQLMRVTGIETTKNRWYRIKTVVSTTSITLVTAYRGPNAAGQAYKIINNAELIIENLTIRNGSLSGVNIQSSTSGPHAMTFRNMLIYGFGGNGFACSAVDTTQPLIIENCISDNNTGYGFSISDGWIVRNCHAFRNISGGFDVLGGSSFRGVRLHSCTADYNDSNGFYLEEGLANGATLIDCRADWNMASGIFLADSGGQGASRNRVIGCQARSNDAYGIRVAGANCVSNIVVDCVALSNTTAQVSDAGTTTSTNNNITA